MAVHYTAPDEEAYETDGGIIEVLAPGRQPIIFLPDHEDYTDCSQYNRKSPSLEKHPVSVNDYSGGNFDVVSTICDKILFKS